MIAFGPSRKSRSADAKKKPLAQRILDAETRGNQYLADANEARESGNYAKAERLWGKGQYWLDRANLLRGWADKPAPKR
jgi:hypothetical protein